MSDLGKMLNELSKADLKIVKLTALLDKCEDGLEDSKSSFHYLHGFCQGDERIDWVKIFEKIRNILAEIRKERSK